MESRKKHSKLPDGTLTYWHNWEINGPDGKSIISLARERPPLEKDKLLNINYLRDYINSYPEALLCNEIFWHTFVILRQKATKNREAASLLRKIGKLLVGVRKNKIPLAELKENILWYIDYFRTMVELTKTMAFEQAYIEIYGVGNQSSKSEKQKSNYRHIYYEYKYVFDILTDKLTERETFCFLENAANNIDKPNVDIHAEPDGRLLNFVKMRTWYVDGSDMSHVNEYGSEIETD